MAFPTKLTINLGTEAEAEAAAKDLCAAVGMAFTPENAHAAAVQLVKAPIDSYRRRNAPIVEAPVA